MSNTVTNGAGSGNQGGFKFTGLDKKGDFSSDKYEIYDPDGNFDFLQNIKIKRYCV